MKSKIVFGVFAVMIALAVYCFSLYGKENNQGVITVKHLLASLKKDDSPALRELLNSMSQHMIEYNIKTGRGITYVVKNMNLNETRFRVTSTTSNNRKAVVVVYVDNCEELASKINIPRRFIENGIEIFLEKESGKWKVDFFETEHRFSDTVYDSGFDFRPGIPKWMPLFPGWPLNIDSNPAALSDLKLRKD